MASSSLPSPPPSNDGDVHRLGLSRAIVPLVETHVRPSPLQLARASVDATLRVVLQNSSNRREAEAEAEAARRVIAERQARMRAQIDSELDTVAAEFCLSKFSAAVFQQKIRKCIFESGDNGARIRAWIFQRINGGARRQRWRRHKQQQQQQQQRVISSKHGIKKMQLLLLILFLRTSHRRQWMR